MENFIFQAGTSGLESEGIKDGEGAPAVAIFVPQGGDDHLPRGQAVGGVGVRLVLGLENLWGDHLGMGIQIKKGHKVWD